MSNKQKTTRTEYYDLPPEERNKLYWSATLLVLFGFLFFIGGGWVNSGNLENSLSAGTIGVLSALAYIFSGLLNMISGYLRIKYRIPRIKEIDPRQHSSTKGSQLLGGALLGLGFIFLTLGAFGLLRLITGI